MQKPHCSFLATGLVRLFSVLLTFVAIGDAAEINAASKQVYTSTETAEFKTLAKVTIEALAAGKQSEMVAKLTALETSWDDWEKVLRPKNEATWTLIDKTLDKAISALRSSRKDSKKGQAALEDLIKELEQSTKP